MYTKSPDFTGVWPTRVPVTRDPWPSTSCVATSCFPCRASRTHSLRVACSEKFRAASFQLYLQHKHCWWWICGHLTFQFYSTSDMTTWYIQSTKWHFLVSKIWIQFSCKKDSLAFKAAVLQNILKIISYKFFKIYLQI